MAGMIATIVCCICVMCTAVLATYGMTVDTHQQHQQLGEDTCVSFFLVYASSTILVAATYYVIIRLSIAAMQTLVFADGRGAWSAVVGAQDEEESTLAKRRNKKQPASDDALSESAPKPSKKERQSQKLAAADDDAAAAPHEIQEAADDVQNNGGGISPWSFSSDDDEDTNSKAAAQDSNKDDDASCCSGYSSSSEMFDVELAAPPHQQGMGERFTFWKVWTNVYGLALGMFCIVYSLLLPNELSGFTFCTCLWMAGVYECTASQPSQSPWLWWCTRKRLLQKKKQIWNEICMMKRAGNAVGANETDRRDSGESSSSSNAVVLTCLCALLLMGIAFKTAGGIVSGKLWGATATDRSGWWWPALASILVPIVGVAAIRNMRRTKDIRNTMELSMPICSMGSLLCLMCIIVADGFTQLQHGEAASCMQSFFWEQVGTEQRFVNAIPPLVMDANSSRAFAHAARSDNFTVSLQQIRHEPIISMFLMPFPLVCSVVAVVSCSRSSHILDVAAAVFLAHSSKPFSIAPEMVERTQSQARSARMPLF